MRPIIDLTPFFKLLLLPSLLLIPHLVFGIGWEVGYGNSIPHVWFGNQKYQYKDEEYVVQPKLVEDSEQGNTYSARLLMDFIGIDYRYSFLAFNVTIPENTVEVAEQSGFTRIISERYGLSLHLRGEVAGIYLAAGQANNKERIELPDGFMEHKSSSMYSEYGVRLFFEAFAIGFSHLRLPVGKHLIKINTTQLFFYF